MNKIMMNIIINYCGSSEESSTRLPIIIVVIKIGGNDEKD